MKQITWSNYWRKWEDKYYSLKHENNSNYPYIITKSFSFPVLSSETIGCSLDTWLWCWQAGMSVVYRSTSKSKYVKDPGLVPDNLSPFYKRTVKTGQQTTLATPAPAPMADDITSSEMFCFSNCALYYWYWNKHPFGLFREDNFYPSL